MDARHQFPHRNMVRRGVRVKTITAKRSHITIDVTQLQRARVPQRALHRHPVMDATVEIAGPTRTALHLFADIALKGRAITKVVKHRDRWDHHGWSIWQTILVAAGGRHGLEVKGAARRGRIIQLKLTVNLVITDAARIAAL